MSNLIQYHQPNVALGLTALVLGVSSSLVVSGTHFSTSFFTLPLLHELPADTSTQLFSKVHRGGAKIGAPLAALSTVMFGLSAYAFASEKHGCHIALAHATGLMFSSFFWTRLAMKGVTRALLDTSSRVKLTDGVDQAEVERLLKKWQWMNLLKGCLTFGGGLIGLLYLANRVAVGA